MVKYSIISIMKTRSPKSASLAKHRLIYTAYKTEVPISQEKKEAQITGIAQKDICEETSAEFYTTCTNTTKERPIHNFSMPCSFSSTDLRFYFIYLGSN